MIKVVAKFFVKEEMIEEFLTLANELVRQSRKEVGCLSYELVQDVDNPEIFIIIEEWGSEEALILHKASGHFTTLVPMMLQLIEKKETSVCKTLF